MCLDFLSTTESRYKEPTGPNHASVPKSSPAHGKAVSPQKFSRIFLLE